MKKRLFLIVLTLVVIVGLGSISFAKETQEAVPSFMKNAFKYFQEQTEKVDNSNEKVFITINGHEYSNKEFLKFKANNNLTRKLNQKEILDESKLKQKFIEQNVLFDEAKKQNITISKKEVEKYKEQVQDILEQSSDENSEVIKVIEQYRESLNMSKEEYWKSLTPRYQKLLSIGKLKSVFFKEYSTLSELSIEKKWDEYVDDLTSKATIE